MKQKAELTVFLSMVLVLLISFIFGILEISVIQSSKNLSRLEADRAVFSIFGEYQKKLLEDYHIFAIEGTYSTGHFEEENLVNRMHFYSNGQADYKVKEIQYLTDNKGQAFKEQVLEYMEQRYGIAAVKNFAGMKEKWEEQSVQGDAAEKQKDESMDIYEEIKNSAEQNEEETNPEENTEDTETDNNPFQYLEKIENLGILSVVVPEKMEISERKADPVIQVSNRSLRTGRGTFPARKNTDGLEEKLLFNEYILKNFASAEIDEKEVERDSSEASAQDDNDTLAYEVEYIIAGKDSDRENLESVLWKLFFIRTGLNYTSLTGDVSRQSQAAAAAAAISTVLLMPEAVELIKQLVLFAWSAGESAVDIRTLLSGKKVPVIKNPENWYLPLSGLLTSGYGSGDAVREDEPGGISYEGYMRMFLFLTDHEKAVMRTLDRIEENMRKGYGMEFFRADQCVVKINVESITKIFGELTYTFPVYFGYE